MTLKELLEKLRELLGHDDIEEEEIEVVIDYGDAFSRELSGVEFNFEGDNTITLIC